MTIQKMKMNPFGTKLWALGFGILLFLALPAIAYACLEIPKDPPNVSVVGDACDGEILVILEDFDSYGAAQGGDYCACALNLPSTYGQVTAAEIVYADTMTPIPGFSFGADPDTSAGFDSLAPVAPPQYWTGFSSAVSQTIAAGIPVDIVFHVSTKNTKELNCEDVPEKVASFLESADVVVGSSGANEAGYPDHHTSIQLVNEVSLIHAPPPPSSCFGQTATIIGAGVINGTSGNDVIVGSPGNDSIDGKGGNDLICALGGDDKVRGGAGSDAIDGGPGNDLLHGNKDSDKIMGSDGNDTILGGAGNDSILGNAGNDRIKGNQGDDFIDGGDGGDDIRGNQGDDTLNGGDGSDHIRGNKGNDTINGGLSQDRLYGNAGDDEIDGGGLDSAYDLCQGGSGSDTLIYCP